MVQAVAGNRRRLVLHFDINNTVVMKDLAKGLNTVDNVSWLTIYLRQFIMFILGISHSMQVSLGKAHTASRYLR